MAEGMKPLMMVEALPGSEPEVGRLLWMLEQTRRRTKECLEDVNPDVLDWTPQPTANSIGALLYHIAAIEADWLVMEVLEEQAFPPDLVTLFPDGVRDETGRLVMARGTSLATSLDRLDVVRGHVVAAFREMSLAEFRCVRDFPDYRVTPEWVLHHLIQHEAEHQGQIGLLRDLGERATGGS
jgi:uncharacterized damage-inducible protein DinB